MQSFGKGNAWGCLANEGKNRVYFGKQDDGGDVSPYLVGRGVSRHPYAQA